MPSVSRADLALLECIETWRIDAAELVDDIGAWRDVGPDDRWRRRWPVVPDNFFSRTQHIFSEAARRHPKLDAQPLQDVYVAVSAWLGDRSAANVPVQTALFGWLEKSMMALQVLERDIMDPTKTAGPQKPLVSLKKRRRRKTTGLTKKQSQAYAMHVRLHSFTAVAQQLGITKQAARRLVIAAQRKVEAATAGRSAGARRLPVDRRGQPTTV